MHKFLFVFTVLFITGCATSPVPFSQSKNVDSTQILAPELQNPSEDRTEHVLIIRDAGLMGSIVDALIAIDGKDSVILKPSQRFEFYLAPGNHMFTIKQVKNMLSEPDGETDIEIRPSGLNSFRLRLVSGDGPRIERSAQILD